MKEVPPEVLALGPDGTVWYGGPIDRTEMSLRANSTVAERDEVSALLRCQPDDTRRHWVIRAPTAHNGGLDVQLSALLARCTADLDAWNVVTSKWKVDLFCGLFMERPNRGLCLNADSLKRLAERGIALGFDIYAPDDPPEVE